VALSSFYPTPLFSLRNAIIQDGDQVFLCSVCRSSDHDSKKNVEDSVRGSRRMLLFLIRFDTDRLAMPLRTRVILEKTSISQINPLDP
jgi:hypothetical protein